MIAELASSFIDIAVDKELENIVKKYGSRYNTFHEAWAVLKEEVEETQEALREFMDDFESIWYFVREDMCGDEDFSELLFNMLEEAKDIAREAVQCAAVCRRFYYTVKGLKEKEDEEQSQ